MSDDLIAKTFAMKTWAVVGATNDPAKYGYKIWHILNDRGYTAYPVHPKLEEIEGQKVFPSIKDLPEKPEVIDMVVNPKVGIAVMKEIAELGVQYVWMQPGTRSDEIREFAKKHNIQLIEDCVLVRIDR